MLRFKYYLFACFVSVSFFLGAAYGDESLKCDFLCDLEKKTSSSIILVGEKHGSSLGKKVEGMLKALACKGDIYLGLEGVLEGKMTGLNLEADCGVGKTKKALIYGLEDELSHAFVIALDSYYYLVYDLKYNNDSQAILMRKLRFILAISPKGIIKGAWKRVSKEREHKFPEFIALLDEYVNRFEKENEIAGYFVQKRLMTDDNFMGNDRAFIELSRAFTREVGTRVHKELEFSDKEFGCFLDLLDDPFNSYNKQSIAEFAVRSRDMVMARNLAKLYCKAQQTGKTVYAIVGVLHLVGIKEHLRHASGGKIKIEEVDLTQE